MDDISTILTRHVTDKEKGDRVNYHSYGAAYARLFAPFDRTAHLNILEVGVDKGGSLAAWREYFPNASIEGVDIVDNRLRCYKDIPGVTFHQMPIHHFIATKEYDIVIDDGSHELVDVADTFMKFYPRLRDDNSMIVIEDVPMEGHWAELIHSQNPTARISIFDRSRLNGGLNNDCLLIIQRARPMNSPA